MEQLLYRRYYAAKEYAELFGRVLDIEPLEGCRAKSMGTLLD